MPELGRVGQDVLTIVILTLHLLWGELLTCDYFTEVTYLPYTYLQEQFVWNWC